MEKRAVTLAGELLKFLLKLPKSTAKGVWQQLKDTGLWPWAKQLGSAGKTSLKESFRRNPYLTSLVGVGGGGLLGYKLSGLGADEDKAYLQRVGEFWNKAQNEMNEAYPGSQRANPLYWTGKGIREFGVNPIINPMIGSAHAGPLTAGILGGLGGAGVGGLVGLVQDGLGGILPGAAKGGGIGALGLGGISALAHRHNAPAGSSSWGFDRPVANPFLAHDAMMKEGAVKLAYSQFGSGAIADPGGVVPSRPDIVSSIYRQPSYILSLRQKQMLSNEVQGLSPYQLKRLMTLLRGATGAGAAFVIAKYLLGLGKKSTIISMILGGIGGAMTGGFGMFPGNNQPRTKDGLIHRY